MMNQQLSQPEPQPDESALPPQPRPKPSILLWLSGVGLWGTLLFGVGGWALGTAWPNMGVGILLAYVLPYIGIPVCAVAIGLLLIYTCREKPWRDTSRVPVAFAWQVLLAALAVMSICMFAYWLSESDRHDAEVARYQEKMTDVTTRMSAAMRADDVTAFSSALSSCGNFPCVGPDYLGTWRMQAVLAAVPQILAVLLKGVTLATYRSADIDNVFPMLCKDGIHYYLPTSLATLVGFRDSAAITAQFMPLWGAQERELALYGAVMAGATQSMAWFVKQGVDLRSAKGISANDTLYNAAALGGSAVSLHWLMDAGLPLPTPQESEDMWRSLADWAASDAPPTLVVERLREWLKWVRLHPNHFGRHSLPLEMAVERKSPILARVLLGNGWSAEELSAYYRADFQALLSRPSSNSKSQSVGPSSCAAGDWQ